MSTKEQPLFGNIIKASRRTTMGKMRQNEKPNERKPNEMNLSERASKRARAKEREREQPKNKEKSRDKQQNSG